METIERLKGNKLQSLTVVVAALWIVVQIVILVLGWNHTLQPDSVEYTTNAKFSYEHGVLYPSIYNLYDRFTHAPGLVNFLIVVYAIFGTFKAAMILNLLMNVAILYEIYYVAKFFFNDKVACVSVLLYCIIIVPLFVPLHILSDHPSYFLFLTGFCLSLQKKWYWVVLAGVCYALSYTIRPTVLAYLVASVVFLIVNKRSYRYYLYLLIPYIGILYGIGKYFENKIGIYTNTSHISGYGMMHSANEKTWAGPDMSFDRDPKNSGYIANADKLTFAEKDSIWKTRAIQWVKDNPKRYALLAPQRFFRCYALDYWSLQDAFEDNQYENAIHSPNPEKALRNLRLKQMMVSVPYYLVLLLFVIALIINIRSVFTSKGIILIITALYTGTTFFLLAEHRGHYSFLFPMVIWAAYGVVNIKRKKMYTASEC